MKNTSLSSHSVNHIAALKVVAGFLVLSNIFIVWIIKTILRPFESTKNEKSNSKLVHLNMK
jgi:hypothetical protein